MSNTRNKVLGHFWKLRYGTRKKLRRNYNKMSIAKSYSLNIYFSTNVLNNIDGLAQDRSNSIANVLESLQDCTKPYVQH